MLNWCGQYHGCWWLVDAWSHGISSCDISILFSYCISDTASYGLISLAKYRPRLKMSQSLWLCVCVVGNLVNLVLLEWKNLPLVCQYHSNMWWYLSVLVECVVMSVSTSGVWWCLSVPQECDNVCQYHRSVIMSSVPQECDNVCQYHRSVMMSVSTTGVW